MDSSIQSCDSSKKHKRKFDATTNTQPRRFNNMMCSTWKISVFGIVALMLAFGLTAGDAFAHSDEEHEGHTRTTVKHFSAASIIVTATSSTGDEGTGGAVGRSGVDLFADTFDDTTETLRATEKLDSLVFTYTHGGVPSKKGTVTLTILVLGRAPNVTTETAQMNPRNRS